MQELSDHTLCGHNERALRGGRGALRAKRGH